MEQIGTSNARQIFYVTVWRDQNWLDNLPSENWAVFCIGESKSTKYYTEFAKKCIDQNVLYICAAGQDCEMIHDLFDEVIVSKKIAKGESIENPEDFENSPMTTWHTNFSEGFWFAVVITHHDSGSIKKIICVDFTKKGVKNHLQNLIEKINDNWLPSDEKNEEPIYGNL